MSEKRTTTEEAPPPGLRRKQDRDADSVEELTPEEKTAQKAQAVEIVDGIFGQSSTPTGDDPKGIAARIQRSQL